MDEPLPNGLCKDIEEYFDGDRDPRGLDLYPELFRRPLFFPLQRQAEMARMMGIARPKSPRVVMEVGADKGGGVYSWCKCLPTVERMIACEVRGTPYSDAFERMFPDVQFSWFPCSSYDRWTVSSVRSWLGADRIDVLFIDGDKSRFDADFEAYLPLMAEQGVVFMHDVTDEAPGSAFRRVAKGRKVEAFVDLRDTELALAKGALGVPPTCAHEGWLRHWAGRSCGVGVVYL